MIDWLAGRWDRSAEESREDREKENQKEGKKGRERNIPQGNYIHSKRGERGRRQEREFVEGLQRASVLYRFIFLAALFLFFISNIERMGGECIYCFIHTNIFKALPVPVHSADLLCWY